MLSLREMAYDKLPSRIWINEHLTFTHGYGLVAGPVNRITPEGLPEFFVKDMPPAVTGGMPKITRPEIYYGETSNAYALVGTRSKELDYPAGDQNVYATYRGRGGISIATWARKLLFAARFGEKNLLLSNDLTAESRLMMYRAVGERLRQIAPFLSFDPDPYIVVTPAGRLVWLIDGYTTTDRYPYSEPARVPGVGNYLRNAVKATVDAYDGTVEFYIADPSDPLVRTYARAFPGLLKPLEQMPVDLRAHIRYPEGFFAIQARMYATYHMEDPQVFYPEATVRAQLAEAQAWIQRHVPDYRIRALALPYGAYPSDVSWLLRGSAKGTTYRHDAVLKVAGGAAPSPFSRAFDPVRLPRIQAIERELAHWLGYFERNPGERFVSDGDPDTVTVPAALRDRLRSELPRRLRIVDR